MENSSKLFLVNGCAEGLFGLACILQSKKVAMSLIPDLKKLSDDGDAFIGLLGPILTAFSYVSILVRKLKDKDNIAKHYFAYAWFMYHLYVTVNTFRMYYFGGNKKMVGAVIFHGIMTAWFYYYLKNNDFNLSLLSPL